MSHIASENKFGNCVHSKLINTVCKNILWSNVLILCNVTSRGVVLYGMTIGRLPFLCPRDEWTTSEERRRRLMIQINRGLTSIQVKAMYQTSIECRNLINRLLVPSARERITVREILDHPWILVSSKSNFHLRSEEDLNVSNHAAVIYARYFRNFNVEFEEKHMKNTAYIISMIILLLIWYFLLYLKNHWYISNFDIYFNNIFLIVNLFNLCSWKCFHYSRYIFQLLTNPCFHYSW